MIPRQRPGEAAGTDVHHTPRRPKMKWMKPAFEIVELSSEVTCYRYHR